MSTEQLVVTTFGVRHSAKLVPEFPSGEMGIGERSGRIVVKKLPEINKCMTRHPREVIGWRLVCQCRRLDTENRAVRLWVDDQFWSRVAGPTEHNPPEFRVFAPDELTIDVIDVDDIAPIVISRWQFNHIRDWTALARMAAAVKGVSAAQEEYEAAVLEAKGTGLVDAQVRATMGLSSKSSDFLGRVLKEPQNG